MPSFGDFEPLCRNVPSYPWCNLFYRQMLRRSPETLQGLSANQDAAPVGVDPVCGIPRVGHDGSVGNVANIVACGLSIFLVGALIFWANRRKAAVGRVELRVFLVLYFLSLPFQLLTTGSFLRQGTTALVVLTAIHAGIIAALFWTLLANGIVATQVVEDGTLSSILPIYIIGGLFFIATTYISLDVGLTFTSTFASNPPDVLRSIPLFVFTSIWPAAAALIYFILMAYVVLGILRERRPMLYFLGAALLFVLSQLDYFLLNKVICQNTDSKIDGSFVATVLETVAVGVLFIGWRSITEDSWEDDYYG